MRGYLLIPPAIQSVVQGDPAAGDVTFTRAAVTYARKPHGYRPFFTVDDNPSVVRVVHVRGGARRRPASGELAEV